MHLGSQSFAQGAVSAGVSQSIQPEATTITHIHAVGVWVVPNTSDQTPVQMVPRILTVCTRISIVSHRLCNHKLPTLQG